MSKTQKDDYKTRGKPKGSGGRGGQRKPNEPMFPQQQKKGTQRPGEPMKGR